MVWLVQLVPAALFAVLAWWAPAGLAALLGSVVAAARQVRGPALVAIVVLLIAIVPRADVENRRPASTSRV